MNQHKDLLYRQKYATYQLNNRTFSTQNTKISARSLAISYICFQVRIVKKKGGGGKPYYQLLRKIWWLPHPRPPTRALYAKLATGEITLPITPDDHLEGPYLLKTRELPGLRPWAPAGALPLHPTRGPTTGHCTTTRMRRALRAHTRCATRTDFSAHPFFCKSWIRHCTHPPLLVQVACQVPCTPPGALRRATAPHPYEARASRTHGALRARIFPAHPFFCKSWIRHCTHPPLLVQVACPQRRRSWGSWGAVAPPPPMEFFFGGGGKHIVFAPPPQ